MKAKLVAAAAMTILLAAPLEAGAGGRGHWGGYGGRYWGGHGGYYGGHGHYYGGGWPYFGLGLVVGGLAGAAWARPYPAYYPYPPAPYYAYPPPPPAPMPPHACGSWVWDDPGYTWYWEPCAPGGPRVVVPQAPAAPIAPEPPMAPPAAEMAPRG